MGLLEKFIIVSVISTSLMMIVVLCQGPPGPKYDVEIQKVLLMNESDYLAFDKIRVKRYNKTVYSVQGGMSFNNDFGDDWEVAMDCWRSKLGNNQWELTPFKVIRQSVGDFIENVYKVQIQNEFSESSTLPVFKDGDPTTPFPKGYYTLTDHMTDIRNFPVFLQDGLYRFEMFMYHEMIVKTGVIFYIKIYPQVG
ncbi:unnamed protein product [Diamesa serratosioi]